MGVPVEEVDVGYRAETVLGEREEIREEELRAYCQRRGCG